MCLAIPMNSANIRINPERLKEARISKGLSASNLAELLEVSRQAVTQFESGKVTPKVETLNKITAILGMEISFFSTLRLSIKQELSILEKGLLQR